MNRRYDLCIHTIIICAVLFAVLLSSSPISADEDLIVYTERYMYDNNETVKFFIIGTNNTTYKVSLHHSDSSFPITHTFIKIDENETRTNGSLGLYGIEYFGVCELIIFNLETNETARTDIKITVSPGWWKGEVDRIIAHNWYMVMELFKIIGAVCFGIILIFVAIAMKFREDAKKAKNEYTLGERLALFLPWSYKYDVLRAAVNKYDPKDKGAKLHLDYKLAKEESMDIQRKLKEHNKLAKRQKELYVELPKLEKDLCDYKFGRTLRGWIWEKMTKKEKQSFLNPGEKS